jgi:D-alanyl-D-alanine dipeptidase
MIYLFFIGAAMASRHPDFVSLSELCPGIRIEASYSTRENFTGEIVPGYKKKIALMASSPATKLCEVQKEASKVGLGLHIFDAYRPVKAVQFFQTWAKREENNPKLKEVFYPRYSRESLFERGFIAKESSHSRGSAVDLSLYQLKSGELLDMGSRFDFFDEISNTASLKVSEEAKKNRRLLKELMEKGGFKNFEQEWWHYSFKPEPYPNDAFDFDVE